MIKLLNEFIKNIKIMFRNWTSLSLLVIAPLVFILLIGYAFSGEEVTGIIIGLISDEEVDLAPLAYNVSTYGVIREYSTVEECLSELALQKIHICIYFRGVVLQKESEIKNLEDFPSGKVVYYYDNTRTKVSLALIKSIQEFLGLKAEQISIESAETIIENIHNLVTFINERKQDVTQIKNESLTIKADLIERKRKLEEVREKFLPPYLVIKDAQTRLHNYSAILDKSTGSLEQQTDNLLLAIHAIKSINNSDPLGKEINDLLNNLEQELELFSSQMNATSTEVHIIILTIDSVVGELDKIKILLDEEIARNDEYIRKIDKSIAKIDEVSQELDTKLEQLTKLQPGTAEKLIKPISYEYEKLLTSVKNIQINFPQLLVLIIMFVTLLFANISTLQETNNKAYMRNLIAPVDDSIYFLGMLFTTIIVVFFQVIVLFIVAQTKLGVSILPTLWQISLITILVILIFALLGMTFAYLFRTVQTSIIITTFSSLIFFLFSNALAPIEAMPGFVRTLSSYNPIVLAEYLIKEIQLFETSFIDLISPLILLIIYACILFLVSIILSKDRNRRRA